MNSHTIRLLLLSLTMASTNAYSGQFIFPNKGQSAEQQEMDEFTCHKWASRQTGYDPTNAQPQQVTVAPPPTTDSDPARAKRGSGVAGALAGATRAAITGGDTGDAAAQGALRARRITRRQERRDNRESEAAAQTAAQQPQPVQNLAYDDYLRARSACLEGKGYTVK